MPRYRSGTHPDRIQVEVYGRDEHRVLGWRHPAYDRLAEADSFVYELAPGPIGSGKAFDVRLRIRVSAG
ncbi:hypothetical protein ACFWWA_29785 [Streptomyces goshikiensis]|uniref:hypothetical protein n=1 Tax=Streptomyces goshikiensis TaxID=1942 RepID=UPI003655DE44